MNEPSTDLLVLHLSDLHFGNHNRFADQDPGQLGQSFAKSLEQARAEKEIDASVRLVIVSGDLAETGIPEEFEQARQFLTALADKLDVATDRFVFVPGNHDISWTDCEKVVLDQKKRKFDEAELRRRMDEVKLCEYDVFLTAFCDKFSVPRLPYLEDLSPELEID